MNRKYLLSFLIFLLLINNCFGQSGWFWQNPLPQGLNFSKIDFVNNKTGFISGGNILKTTDAGENWFNLNNGSFLTLDFVDNNIGYAIGYSNIQKTTNGGLN